MTDGGLVYVGLTLVEASPLPVSPPPNRRWEGLWVPNCISRGGPVCQHREELPGNVRGKRRRGAFAFPWESVCWEDLNSVSLNYSLSLTAATGCCIRLYFATTKYKLGGLKQQKFLSQFWNIEVRNPGVSRAMLSPTALGDDPSLPRPGFWNLPAISGVPWLQVASVQPLPLSSHGFLPSVSVSVPVCVFTWPLIRTPVIGFRACPNPV